MKHIDIFYSVIFVITRTFFVCATTGIFSSSLSSECVLDDDGCTGTTFFFALVAFFLLADAVSFGCFLFVDFFSFFVCCFDLVEKKKTRQAIVEIKIKAKTAPDTIDNGTLRVNCSSKDTDCMLEIVRRRLLLPYCTE